MLLWPTTPLGPARPNGSVFKCRKDGWMWMCLYAVERKSKPSRSLLMQ